ncbi:MAG: hypothetical protein HRT66_12500 [Flavobacteriaceae bacterium]|nr:hypothetical protein [Flavobacteriaceae bacterium]
MKINTSNSYIELDISKLNKDYAYITAHDQSEQVVGKLRVYRSGGTILGPDNQEGLLLGNPLVDMEIVGTAKDPQNGGSFGKDNLLVK